MSRKVDLRHLARSLRALPEAAPGPADAHADAETQQLAREMARAFAEKLEQFRRAGAAKDNPRDPAQPAPDWFVESLLQCPPEDVTFADLEQLTRIDPGRMAARWDEVKATARRDLDSGWIAARALEPHGGSAWERACFHSVRQSLRQAWPPRNALEAYLLDEMAQYESVRQSWLRVLAAVSRLPQVRRPPGEGESRGDKGRPQSAAEATIEAAQMVERLQRLFHNAVRMLLNLRRVKTPIVVRRAGQVNVTTGPQLNVNEPCSVEATTETVTLEVSSPARESSP